MARFFGIGPGETVNQQGLRVSVPIDGERVYMGGKWLDLGSDHAVVVYRGRAEFCQSDGKVLFNGQFPGWLVRGKGKSPLMALMFNVGRFSGGKVRFTDHAGMRQSGPL